MPLLGHFRPPLTLTHTCRTFHGTWAVVIARILNAGVLPPGYYAAPFRDRDGPIEIDVATLGSSVSSVARDGAPRWAPEPALAVAVAWPETDDVRVEVRSEDGDPPLAAAIELVSPRNKDRASAREAFAAKCADHLHHGRGLVVVDIVTTRRADLQAELLTTLDVKKIAGKPEGLSAVSYRSIGRAVAGRLQVWPSELTIGKSLPTLPLWLGEFAVPLDLEASYTAACADLRIRQTG
ncbi:DUF4058 family protein [Gemmata sp. JC717]|uniref:DUF4058 family protein n=1 Tax=Gemmata algarum TaxID=2975278 RepID=UPI0021BA5061|nr:DUF4058 family protein [Gemmata algarum]MDY3557016.1 DUF4058 family protein [Gemmata algarum]